MVKKIKTTLEDLAVMVQNGFQHMDEKFMGKFDEVNKRLDGHDERFIGLENKTHEMNARLMRVEKDVSEIKDHLEPHKFEFEDLSVRVKYIEKNLGIKSGK